MISTVKDILFQSMLKGILINNSLKIKVWLVPTHAELIYDCV